MITHLSPHINARQPQDNRIKVILLLCIVFAFGRWLQKHTNISQQSPVKTAARQAGQTFTEGRMKSLWELRWLSLLLFMADSWLLCDKRGRRSTMLAHHIMSQWLLVAMLTTSCHRAATCYSAPAFHCGPSFSTITSSFPESNYTTQTENTYI